MTAPSSVSDFLSNVNDQLVNAAKLMCKSTARQQVFEAIYKGQKQEKSVRDIMHVTGLTQIRVLNVAKKLGPLVEKVPNGFRKRRDLADHYKKILVFARSKKKRESVPTKVSPKTGVGGGGIVRIAFAPSAARAIRITIEDIDSFSAAKKNAKKMGPISEQVIKHAFSRIAGDGGKFKDWGGEKSDLYTDKLRVYGARRAVAVAFKGKGTTGKLVPAKMGKNGDQIDRLFDEPAEVFLIVYCGQIDSSIVSQMQAFAIAKKALGGRKVYFGVIDDNDLGRIAAAYPSAFEKD